MVNHSVSMTCPSGYISQDNYSCYQLDWAFDYHEFHETSHSVTIIVLVNSHQR